MKTPTKVTGTPLVTCHKHWLSYFWPAIITLLLVISGIGEISESAGPGIMLILIGVIVFIICHFNIRAEYLCLSETDVTGKRGVIKTSKLMAPISRIQDVSVSNGLFGKIFGYYTITVSTAGTGKVEFVFHKVTNAQAFQDKYIELANKST